MPVEGKHQRVSELTPSWETIRDVTSGPRAVRAKATRYLPKLPSHAKKSGLYEAYLARAVFDPVAARTLRAFVGLVCCDEPDVEVPNPAILDDITLTGVTFEDFSREVFRQALAPGRVGILVDLPPEGPGVQPRAFQRLYAAESILDWREETIGQLRRRLAGVDSAAVRELAVSEATRMISHLRLLDRITVPNRDDPWSTWPADQVRVMDLVDVEGVDGPTLGVRIQLYRQPLDDRGRPTRGKFELLETLPVPKRRGVPVPFVPFVAINTMTVSLEPEEPSLLGLCELNLSQYRSSADLENGRFKLGHPQLTVFGTTGGTYEAGDGVWEFDSPASRVEVLQVQDQFGGLERAISEKAEQMVAEGARLMAATQSNTAETATAARLKATGERSLLVMAAKVVGQGLERALTYHAWWEDGVATLPAMQETVWVELREEFDEAELSGPDAEAWLRTQVGGGISKHTLRGLYRRGGIYEDGWTDDLEAAAIEQDQASGMVDLPADTPPIGQPAPPMQGPMPNGNGAGMDNAGE